jgi:hypothetical protein
MAICTNCNVHLDCGCQRINASDGTVCCEQCVAKYEESLKPVIPVPPPQTL